MSEIAEKNPAPALAVVEKIETPPHILVLTLMVFGILSGFAHVGIFLATKNRIEANKAEATREAIFKVLPGCEKFDTLELRDGVLVKVENTKSPDRVFAGFYKDGNLAGFAIDGAEPGFADLVRCIFGFRPDKGVIIGFDVLESRETPGLGDKLYKDADFVANFKALAVDPEILGVKRGEKVKPAAAVDGQSGASAHASNQVEMITGATISSKCVVRLLNKAIHRWRGPIKDYLAKNPGSAGGAGKATPPPNQTPEPAPVVPVPDQPEKVEPIPAPVQPNEGGN